LEVVHAAAARDRNDNEEDINEIGTMKKKMNGTFTVSFHFLFLEIEIRYNLMVVNCLCTMHKE
jgi:hypothetical protein